MSIQLEAVEPVSLKTAAASFSSDSQSQSGKKQSICGAETVILSVNESKSSQKSEKNKQNDKFDSKKDKKGKKVVTQPLSDWVMPDFMTSRMKLFERIKSEQDAERAKLPRNEITITLPDGKTIPAKSNETTPLDIAKQISNSLAERVLIAKVDSQPWDLTRPLEKSCTLELFDFDSPFGAETFWHSSAHVLGQTVEQHYPDVRLGTGPPLVDGGFYYDVRFGADGEGKVSQEDFENIKSLADKVVKEKQIFERVLLTRDQALEMFAENSLKQHVIGKVPENAQITAYRCGTLIDLCRGPHIPHTGLIKAFELTKNSSAYWQNNSNNPSMQRIYGMSFPDKGKLKEWKELVKQAALRDHRKIGADQQLFFFNELSPGSAFFLPHGARIYNKLMDFIRKQYHKRGYTEVITPNVYNIDLWKTSGHYDNYKENMFTFEVEKQEFGMKPMNCPGHCVMYRHDLKSYRDLPIRLADFGVLHRNEISGALSGLTRVRRFQQDDAHIFAREDQIQQEVGGVLDMLQEVYGFFGFQFTLMLSTRPEKFLGEIETWDAAETQLKECLDKFVSRPEINISKWQLNPGDGAFYGPKIDIQLQDALKRRHQCATIQLDFQLPQRFDLKYQNDAGGYSRPVMVHRAILGSVERMIAVLCEHTGGKWPLWISPRQVAVVPIASEYFEYARKVGQILHQENYYVDVDDSNDQLKYKIRAATLKQYNYILVVGEKEKVANSVNVRPREDPEHPYEIRLEEFISHLRQRVSEYK